MIDSLIYQPAEDSYLLSEALKKEIPELLEKNKDLKFLEIGCGSGIQLQTALECGVKKENILGADINDNAVKHCRNMDFNVVFSDLFSDITGKFDVIAFNPPYLPDDSREPESSKISTTGGKQGGELINKFLNQAKKYLAESGKVIILVSSLTEGIEWNGFRKRKLAEKKLFMEKLHVLELSRKI